MTHPPNVCSLCENGRDPVTKNNGFGFTYEMVAGVTVEVFLHDGYIQPWREVFNVTPPASGHA